MRIKQMNRKCKCFAERLKRSLYPSEEAGTIAPLSQSCRRGRRKKVCKITGDRKLCAQMANLGVYPGEEIEIVCYEKGSQCVLKVHGANISLDQETSNNILVQSL